ncbi:hypothetical protein PMIN01_06225 [Paraphaeosphaeria minitans]|uniref:Uncharacterized protein n=1 Tax=Paraphaeosphaeria minitans TaxID=565426 RepID=A0A9P6GLF6_9PLEO|nr:hypothetical protein PMIN01_06225 [Paraphaeosphaeria minitans]
MLLQIASIVLTCMLNSDSVGWLLELFFHDLGLSYTNSTPSNSSAGENSLTKMMNEARCVSQLDVRTGYFGMCVRQRGVVWICSSDASGLAIQIGQENDPLDLIGAAARFKGDVIFSGLLFMAVVVAFASVLLLATFPSWHEETDNDTGSTVGVKAFPSQPLSQVSLACSFIASMLLLTSSLWQHIGSVGAGAMAEISYQGNVHTSIGTQAVTMAWPSFTL